MAPLLGRAHMSFRRARQSLSPRAQRCIVPWTTYHDRYRYETGTFVEGGVRVCMYAGRIGWYVCVLAIDPLSSSRKDISRARKHLFASIVQESPLIWHCGRCVVVVVARGIDTRANQRRRMTNMSRLGRPVASLLTTLDAGLLTSRARLAMGV